MPRKITSSAAAELVSGLRHPITCGRMAHHSTMLVFGQVPNSNNNESAISVALAARGCNKVEVPKTQLKPVRSLPGGETGSEPSMWLQKFSLQRPWRSLDTGRLQVGPCLRIRPPLSTSVYKPKCSCAASSATNSGTSVLGRTVLRASPALFKISEPR